MAPKYRGGRGVCLLLTLTLILVALIVSAKESFSKAPAIQMRQIGGHNAPINRFPYLSRYPYFALLKIVQGGQHFMCGGFLIKPNIVMTAAHCLYKNAPSDVTVYLGTRTIAPFYWTPKTWYKMGTLCTPSTVCPHLCKDGEYIHVGIQPPGYADSSDVCSPTNTLNIDEAGVHTMGLKQWLAHQGAQIQNVYETFVAKNIYIPRTYKPPSLNNDWALILLPKPASVKPVKLQTVGGVNVGGQHQVNVNVQNGTAAVDVGFGNTVPGEDSTPSILQENEIYLKDVKSDPYFLYGGDFPGTAKKHVICQGDSGGPLLIKGSAPEQDIVIGINSHTIDPTGQKSCQAVLKRNAGYTRIPDYFTLHSAIDDLTNPIQGSGPNSCIQQ